jgi:hypothetical protein
MALSINFKHESPEALGQRYSTAGSRELLWACAKAESLILQSEQQNKVHQ